MAQAEELQIGRRREQQGDVRVGEERLDVNTRPVVKEEVVISKEQVTEQRPIEADLRREELDEPSSGRVREDVKGRGGE